MSLEREPYRLERYGESAYLILSGAGIDEAAYRRLEAFARRLEAGLKASLPEGIAEPYLAYDSLLVRFDPLRVEAAALEASLRALLEAEAAETRADAPGSSSWSPAAPRVVELPITYGGECGPDLERLARAKGLSPEELGRRHASGRYLAYALGFLPGFPYLGGLAPELAAPRLATPRSLVPAGSVGIADAQTGVYPVATPGGWNIIGRTSAVLFDPGRDPPNLIEPGDVVRFVPSEPRFRASAASAPRTPLASAGDPGDPGGARVLVVEAGPQTTVQDEGRSGYERIGVPRSGAMDERSLALANILVGNRPGDAGLECAAGGLRLRFSAPVAVAVTGAELAVELNGSPAPRHRTLYAEAGDELSLGWATSGMRAYVAFAGGLALEPVMGSLSTTLRGGFGGLGGRALRAGDELPLRGCERRPPERELPSSAIPAFPAEAVVRALPLFEAGRLAPGSIETLFSAGYTVGRGSDRMGLRLEGPALGLARGADIVSSPVLAGTIQVPGDGLPIILAADAQTMGGYVRAAQVASVDLPVLGQARPGDRLRLAPVSREEALALLGRRSEWYRRLPSETIVAPARLRRAYRVWVDGLPYEVGLEERS